MKHWPNLLFLCFSFFLSAPLAVWAASCEPVDLRSEFGPIRQQFDREWCASFIIADLIGHKLKIMPPDMISAFDVAVAYVAFSPKDAQLLPASARELVESATKDFKGLSLDERRGGYPFRIYINYVYRGRLCLESEIRSEGMKMDRPDVFNFVDRRLQSENRTLTLLKKIRGSVYSDLGCEQDIAEDFSLANVHSTGKALNDWLAAKVSMRFDRLCSPHQGLKDIRKSAIDGFDFKFREDGKEAFQEKIDSILDQKKPFAIAYDANAFLKNPNPESDLSHYSVVAGRKWDKDTNTCKLLIRNSWGRSCDGYNSLVECEAGYLWIPENELLQKSKYILKIE